MKSLTHQQRPRGRRGREEEKVNVPLGDAPQQKTPHTKKKKKKANPHNKQKKNQKKKHPKKPNPPISGSRMRQLQVFFLGEKRGGGVKRRHHQWKDGEVGTGLNIKVAQT